MLLIRVAVILLLVLLILLFAIVCLSILVAIAHWSVDNWFDSMTLVCLFPLFAFTLIVQGLLIFIFHDQMFFFFFRNVWDQVLDLISYTLAIRLPILTWLLKHQLENIVHFDSHLLHLIFYFDVIFLNFLGLRRHMFDTILQSQMLLLRAREAFHALETIIFQVFIAIIVLVFPSLTDFLVLFQHCSVYYLSITLYECFGAELLNVLLQLVDG